MCLLLKDSLFLSPLIILHLDQLVYINYKKKKKSIIIEECGVFNYTLLTLRKGENAEKGY